MEILKIEGAVKEYAWGTLDYITNLTGIKKSGPIAEYWLGTHPLGEATCEDGKTLSCCLGKKLPSLFKVLSINTPLAIQNHPTTKQAIKGFQDEELRHVDPEKRNYPDSNEKAEAYIALTESTALYGFRKIEEIKNDFLLFLPDSHNLVDRFSTHEELFDLVFSLKTEERIRILSELKFKVENYVNRGAFLEREEILRRVLKLYPDDISCLFVLIMNVLHINAGQALYIEPNVIHAYCFGNGLEIMTCSDNMTRLGLTKRYTDIPAFKEIAFLKTTEPVYCKTIRDAYGRYEYEFPSSFRLAFASEGSFEITEDTDTVVFVESGNAVFNCKNTAINLKTGQSVFISQGTTYTLRCTGKVYFSK